jgi:hypothetical protein
MIMIIIIIISIVPSGTYSRLPTNLLHPSRLLAINLRPQTEEQSSVAVCGACPMLQTGVTRHIDRLIEVDYFDQIIACTPWAFR